MSITLVGIIGIAALLFILFVFGIPVGFAMGLVGFVGFSYVINMNAGFNMLGAVIWDTFASYGLTVIPLFIFMGQIAFYSGVNEKLYTAAYTWVGHVKGGIAMATVMACAAFAAICGSNAATAATMTTVALPQMTKYNYEPMLSTGAIACGSTLGVVIPAFGGADYYRAVHGTVHCRAVLRRAGGRNPAGHAFDCHGVGDLPCLSFLGPHGRGHQHETKDPFFVRSPGDAGAVHGGDAGALFRAVYPY